MIDVVTKIHDQFTLEFKVGFLTREGREPDDFSLALWMFVPGSLDITPATYPKSLFYSDVKSNIRLITPAFALADVAGGSAELLGKLRLSAENAMTGKGTATDFEYNVKMFCAIAKSSLREGLASLGDFSREKAAPWEKYILDAESLYDGYRSTEEAPLGEEIETVFRRGEEFLGDIISRYLMELAKRLEGEDAGDVREKAVSLYRKIGRHKGQMGFPIVMENSPEHNRKYTHRFSALKKYIEEGYGVIYLALSSAITSGLNNANLAKDDLMEEFPDANIVLIDSLCACGGYGLYAYHVCKYQNEGHSMEETVKYAEELKKHEIHNFTVGDLKYLARSGRLSKGEAFLGNLANIKPVLHVDDEGRLVPLYKTHGRRKSIEGLFNDMQKRIGDYENDYLLIDHGACREDAEFLRDLIVSKTGFTNIIIDNVGPVIGAHAGPGVMTLFHLGEKR